MEEKKCGVTFSKVTALLCALVMLFGLIAFFGGEMTRNIKYLNEQIESKNEQIQQQESRIEQLEQDIARYQQQKQEKEDELAKIQKEQEAAIQDVEAKEKALQQAENDLDKVCTRSYYSSWSCSTKCKSLHTAVSNRKTELNNAKNALGDYEDIKDDIEDLAEDIARTEGNIETAQDYIAELKAERKEFRSELAGAWFMVIFKTLAMLLALGGLGLLAKIFYTGEQSKLTIFAVAGLAASALLFLIAGAINNALFENAPLAYLLLSPYTWNLAVMGLFAAVLLKKTDKPVVLRNIAVVLTVILGVLAFALGASFTGLLYAAAMICAAFVIVPLVFTEYIDIAKHIFLSIITFGIWQLVWVYHVTKNLNKVEDVEERRPARELLLSLFLAFYYPFWLYKTAEGVEDYGKENGKEFKIDVLCIAFSFISPLFATVLIQNKINVVVGKPVLAPVETAETLEQVEAEAVEEEAEAVEAEAKVVEEAEQEVCN